MRRNKSPIAKTSASLCAAIALGLALTTVAMLALLVAQPIAVSAAPPTAPPYPDQRNAVSEAVDWLVVNHQNDDGGYTNFSSGANQAPSDASGTADAILAIASSGKNPGALYTGITKTPLDWMHDNSASVASYAAVDGGQAGKVVMALVAAAQNPRYFEGYNFVISVTNHLSPTGQYGVNTAYKQSLAIMALKAVSESIPLTATQWLTSQQATDGSWDDGFGTPRNPDSTAMALMALVAVGVPTDDLSIVSATTFLADAQLDSGGWEYGTGFGENANSTALAVQALSALGEDFYSTSGPWAKGSNTPLSALLEWQNTTGAFKNSWALTDDFFATVQAIPAATGKPYPLVGRYEAARLGVMCLENLQKADGSWDQFADTGYGGGEPGAGTARAIEAIVAFGEDPTSARWTPGANNALQALENHTPSYLSSGRGGRVGIVMQGVMAAAEYNPTLTVTNFSAYNLVISVTSYLSPTGEYADTAYGPFAHDEAMLGLIKSGFEVAPTATIWLLNAHTDGDWGGSDSNGISLNVLGRLNSSPASAIANAMTEQHTDGGWYSFFPPSDPNATSEMVQGLIASGYNPFDPSWSKVVDGHIVNPADMVMGQQATNGCWLAWDGATDDPYATTDAVLMLMQDPPWPTGTFGPGSEIYYLPLIFKNAAAN